MDIATSKSHKKNGLQKSENSREKAENLSQKRVLGDTLPMCSPNLQIEVDSKRSQKRQARSLALKSSSSLQRLSFCPSFDEQSRKAKQKQKKKAVNLSILNC